MKPCYLQPDWPAPACVQACTTTRGGGHSQAPYASFNLADYVGDDAQAVRYNRLQLQTELALPAEPLWLHQVHGSAVVDAASSAAWPDADASYTTKRGVVCAVLTADCLPILLCDAQGTAVASVHAGWRGLVDGVIATTCAALATHTGTWFAWLGPAISATAFEVGDDVYHAFITQDKRSAAAFTAKAPDKWHADLYAVARQQLHDAGVTAIFGGEYCTYTDETRFFSYRRQANTGRMASLIWLI